MEREINYELTLSLILTTVVANVSHEQSLGEGKRQWPYNILPVFCMTQILQASPCSQECQTKRPKTFSSEQVHTFRILIPRFWIKVAQHTYIDV